METYEPISEEPMKVESGLSERFKRDLLEAIKVLKESGTTETEVGATGMKVRRQADAPQGQLAFSTFEVDEETFLIYTA